jgi:hypothetical protein
MSKVWYGINIPLALGLGANKFECHRYRSIKGPLLALEHDNAVVTVGFDLYASSKLEALSSCEGNYTTFFLSFFFFLKSSPPSLVGASLLLAVGDCVVVDSNIDVDSVIVVKFAQPV